jgi:hypothetical protein
MPEPITGFVDGCDDGAVTGWAARAADTRPVQLEVLVDGVLVGEVTANLYREDLVKAGIGQGLHGFEFRLPDRVRSKTRYTVDVRDAQTGQLLQHSPFSVAETPDRPFSSPARVRRFIALQYFAGEGLEVGALHRPLAVPPGVLVRYADSRPTDELLTLWSLEVDNRHVVPVDIVTDATTLAGIADGTFDFAIASHVIEHLEDPLGSVFSLLRVVKPGGAVFIAIPDRRFTFDAARPPTSFDHVVRDYCGGTAASRDAHYREWVTVVEGLAGETAHDRMRTLSQERYPIHFHVWQPAEFTDMLRQAKSFAPVGFEIDLYKNNPPEGIWVLLRK